MEKNLIKERERKYAVEELMDEKSRQDLFKDWMQTYGIKPEEIKILRNAQKDDYIISSIVEEDEISKGQILVVNLLQSKTKIMNMYQIPLYKVDKRDGDDESQTICSNMVICQTLLEIMGSKAKLYFDSWARNYMEQIEYEEKERVIIEKLSPQNRKSPMIVKFI